MLFPPSQVSPFPATSGRKRRPHHLSQPVPISFRIPRALRRPVQPLLEIRELDHVGLATKMWNMLSFDIFFLAILPHTPRRGVHDICQVSHEQQRLCFDLCGHCWGLWDLWDLIELVCDLDAIFDIDWGLWERRELARSLALKSYEGWFEFARSNSRPSDIPSSPWMIYKHQGWIDLGDWLGSGRFLPFKEARKFVRGLGLRSCAEWRRYSRSKLRLREIPSQPEVTYRSAGWVGWSDWLDASQTTRRDEGQIDMQNM